MKSRADSKFKSDLGFMDMLFNMIIGFAFLFCLSFIIIQMLEQKKSTTDANTKMKAELVMNMTWPDDVIDDIDMWLLLPTGHKIYYSNKDAEVATLDRDDRGGVGDIFWKNATEQELVKLNRETITIRAVIPGRYVVSAHMFSEYTAVGSFQAIHKLPYEVKYELIKLNPRVEHVATSTVVLERQGQEETFISFEVKEDGSVVNVQQHPAEKLVSTGS